MWIPARPSIRFCPSAAPTALYRHRSERAGMGLAAAFGAKLARPDVPVVSVVGDGSFCFSGPQPLWTQSRYKAPIINIVLNNHSYNNERNRIWHYGGRQFQTGGDMTCYLGSPDVD